MSKSTSTSVHSFTVGEQSQEMLYSFSLPMVSPDLGPPTPRKVDLGLDQGTAAVCDLYTVTSKGELGRVRVGGESRRLASLSEKRWNSVSTYSTDIY